MIENVLRPIGVDCGYWDIEACHRLAKKKPWKPAPVIVRFRNRKDAVHSVKNRNQLKQNVQLKGVFITDNLCPTYSTFFDKLSELKNEGIISHVWSYNGKVSYKATPNRWVKGTRIAHIDDLKPLMELSERAKAFEESPEVTTPISEPTSNHSEPLPIVTSAPSVPVTTDHSDTSGEVIAFRDDTELHRDSSVLNVSNVPSVPVTSINSDTSGVIAHRDDTELDSDPSVSNVNNSSDGLLEDSPGSAHHAIPIPSSTSNSAVTSSHVSPDESPARDSTRSVSSAVVSISPKNPSPQESSPTSTGVKSPVASSASSPMISPVTSSTISNYHSEECQRDESINTTGTNFKYPPTPSSNPSNRFSSQSNLLYEALKSGMRTVGSSSTPGKAPPVKLRASPTVDSPSPTTEDFEHHENTPSNTTAHVIGLIDDYLTGSDGTKTE